MEPEGHVEAPGLDSSPRGTTARAQQTGRAARGRAIASSLPAAVLVVAALAFPVVAESQTVNVGIFAGLFAIAAIGLQLMMGLAGQANLGQAGFFAVGAYTSAVLVTKFGWGPTSAALVALLLTLAFGFLVGLPLLRLKGYYLALATFGFGIIVAVLANEWSFLGHTTGIFAIPKFRSFGFVFRGETSFFYLVWGLALLAVLLARNLTSSRVGRAWAALHDSEVAAETLGVDTFWLRLQVLVVSAGTASVAGSLYAHWVSVINPAAASFVLSIELIGMAVVGGLTSVWGPIVGAVFIEALGESLQITVPRLIGGSTGEIQLIVFGIVLAAVLVFMPDGIVGVVHRTRLRFRRSTTDDRADATARPAVGRRASEAVAGGRTASVDVRPSEPGGVVLSISGVSKRFGGVEAVSDVAFEVAAGEIVALIGPNGAGKTTLFNVISGVISPTAGRVTIAGDSVHGFQPHEIARRGVARTFQNLELFSSLSVLDNVKVGCHLRGQRGVTSGALHVPARAEERRINADAWGQLDVVGLDDVAGTLAVDLPFGRQRLVELARALAAHPRLLLLDEPMAGLSLDDRSDLAAVLRALRDEGMAVLLVEHDMQAVMALADRIVVLDNGELIAEGSPSEIQADRKVIEAYLGAETDFADLRS